LRIFGLGKHLAELDGTVNAASESLAEVEEAMIAGADGLVECCGSTATSWHRWLIAFAGDTYRAITDCLGEVDQINEWATVIESPDVPAEKGWGRTESHPCELPGLPDAFKSPGEFAEWWLEEVECVQECVDACGWPDPIRLEAELEREFVGAWKHKDSGDQPEEKVSIPTRLQSTILKALDGQALKKPQEQADKIPPEERTVPMSYRRAARLMGKGDGKDAAEWLSASVIDGSIRCEHLSRQTHVFSKLVFHDSVWPQILPKSPKNPPNSP
jgi:hypothetical protein